MLRNKSLNRILTAGVLFFCALSIASAQKNSADNAALLKFEKNIEQGNYAGIERDLLNYAIANPNDAKGFELLGKLRFAQNRLNEAKSLYQKALSIDSQSVSTRINLAVIDFHAGNAALALSGLNKISDQNITNSSLRLKLAQTYALAGDCRKALDNVEKLDLKIKNSAALPVRARCTLQFGEKPKTISLIPLAKGLSRQNPEIAVNFAEVLSDAAMYKESADVLRSVVATTPRNAEAMILLAKSEIYLKDFANAKVHLNRAAKISPNSLELLFTQGLLESGQGNAQQALDLLEKSLTVDPNSTTVLSQYVFTAIRANQGIKAFKAAERLLVLKPDEPMFLYLHGAAALQSNKLRTAEDSLNRFVALRPQDSRGCLALGLTYAAQPEKFESARKQLFHCLEINPNNFEAKYQLGLSYKTQGETAKAIPYLEETVKLSPNYALALRDLGALYLQTGAESKARVVLEKAVAINPNDADTHFQLSRVYNLLGETALAKKHLETFQKLRNTGNTGM